MSNQPQSANSNFVDLHVHSNYSFRDGVSPIEELIASAVELGRPTLALTDHGHAAGFVELQAEADKAGLAQPIFGVDMPVSWPDNNALTATPGEWACEGCGAEANRLATGQKSQSCHNVVLLARDQTGLQNLFRLLTWSGTTGYDLNGGTGPLLTEEMLLNHAAGLTVLSGGPSGQLSRLLASNQTEEALAVARRYREAFGENFGLEIVSSQSKAALADRQRLVNFGLEHQLPIVATNDVHYVKSEQAVARDLLWAIADNVRLNAPNRRRPGDQLARPLSQTELAQHFAELPEALEQAARFAAECRVRLPKTDLIIPDFPIPAEFADDAGRYLRQICQQNLTERYGQSLPAVMQERLDYELAVIERAGFARYILIVADIVRQAKQLKILCAPRGSSAGSLVCYACGITPLNPLDYGLLFERFLNEARIAPPDIDLDIADEARPLLLDYVVRRYGIENVSHIITHNFEGAKSALRDAGKALGSDPFLVNRLVGLVPIEFQKPFSLTRTLAEEPETARLYQKDPAVKELIDHARLIEGSGRNSGTHAAGVVITPRPIAEYVPLTRTEGLGQQQRNALNSEGEVARQINIMTQWNMEDVEKRGLLKIDLLGLTAWSTIGHALEFIRRQRQLELDIWTLPPTDTPTYQMLSQGYTIGVFQLEKQGMTDFTIGMKPQSIPDLALMIAAYRPGPMPFLGKLLAVRHGREPLKVPHPLLEPLMAETYGVPVYQETMLKIAQEVAGYTLGEADVLRKAIGKKNQKELVAQQLKFREGAAARGLTPAQVEAVWEMFPPFAFYGFNQAHAMVYGYLTYITAYLKLHYPLEYLGGLLTVAGGDTEAIVKAVAECRRLGVPILGPDVNHSSGRLTIEQLPDGTPALRFGLATIKGLGPTGLEALESTRQKEGPFTSLTDFVRRVPGRAITSKTLTALARVGAFPFGNRATLEAAVPVAQKAAKAKTLLEPEPENLPEHPLDTLLSYEYDLLGIHLTPLPVAETIERLQAEGRITTTTLGLAEDATGPVRVGGAITGGREVQSRYGLMYVFQINDGYGLLEVSVFPKLYREKHDLLKEGRLIVVEGKAEHHEGRARLQANKIEAA